MKLDTGTELPTEFKLTKEFLDFYNLIEETNQNLFITGKAKGQTVHAFFKFPPRFISKKDVKFLYDKEKINKLDTLLIDESSMLRADLFDAINHSLKKNRGNKKPFGGVQIILFGDLLQLPPIVSDLDKEVVEKFYPKGEFFFKFKGSFWKNK